MTITFHDYSEKAFVLAGDTKEIKDTLKAVNAKFNPYLSVGKGWIFSKSKQASILEKIKQAGTNTFTPTQIIELLSK